MGIMQIREGIPMAIQFDELHAIGKGGAGEPLNVRTFATSFCLLEIEVAPSTDDEMSICAACNNEAGDMAKGDDDKDDADFIASVLMPALVMGMAAVIGLPDSAGSFPSFWRFDELRSSWPCSSIVVAWMKGRIDILLHVLVLPNNRRSAVCL